MRQLCERECAAIDDYGMTDCADSTRGLCRSAEDTSGHIYSVKIESMVLL